MASQLGTQVKRKLFKMIDHFIFNPAFVSVR